jgi:hypothetical protein
MKKTNQYADALGDSFTYTPKAVFAALAFSYASFGGDQQDAKRNLLREWETLHANGIVPQPPSRRVKEAAHADGHGT